MQRGLSILQADIAKVCKRGNYRALNLRVDVLGFSRGAAAARHFIHAALHQQIPDDVNDKPSASLKQRLEQQHLKVKDLIFGFVGLFDTVASLGLGGTAAELSSTRSLHLDAIRYADAVFQISASDEHRANFALTDISSAGTRGRQIALPGVHCDIGGSYVDYTTETFSILDAGSLPVNDWVVGYIRCDLERWIKDGWFTWADVQHRAFPGGMKSGDPIRNAILANGKVTVFRSGNEHRGLRNMYSLIALHLMRNEAEARGLEFLPSIRQHRRTSLCNACPSIIPEVFRIVRNDLNNQRTSTTIPDALLRELRRNYFHCSANYDRSFNAFAPRFVRSVRTRLIHNG